MQFRQRGLTLIELMLAMTLGMGVTLAATALLAAAKTSYLAVSDGARVQENGRYALDLIARSVRQANYLPHDDAVSLRFDPAAMPPGVHGLDNARLTEQSSDVTSPSPNPGAHGSDVLAMRFFGSGSSSGASMLNCAGIAVDAPAAANVETIAQERGWSIFYVADDATGEPELRCKYPTRKGGWSAAAIVRGVESFQVLYGVRDGGNSGNGGIVSDGDVEFLNAARMQTRWRDVVAVKVALLMRGEHNAGDASPVVHRLFGPSYSGHADPGVVVDEAMLAPHLQRRIRKVVETTVHLRNPAP